MMAYDCCSCCHWRGGEYNVRSMSRVDPGCADYIDQGLRHFDAADEGAPSNLEKCCPASVRRGLRSYGEKPTHTGKLYVV